MRLITDFRGLYLPYCLVKQDDGRYIILNRIYKPLGVFSQERVDYGSYPIRFKIHKKLIIKLSIDGKSDTDSIYLYNDGTNPVRGKKYMGNYLAKVAILAKFSVKC
jgi:hypothetical protein